MKGDGNGIRTILRKLHFLLILNSAKRTKYIYKNKKMFHKIGEKVFWQSRKFPADPELISIGNNVKIAANVQFINHDIIHDMLNDSKLFDNVFIKNEGCIEIGDHVMIGANVVILPNVKIGSNVIIGAGSIVTKNVPSNVVAAGVPCKVVGTFDRLVEKYGKIEKRDVSALWDEFNGKQ